MELISLLEDMLMFSKQKGRKKVNKIKINSPCKEGLCSGHVMSSDCQGEDMIAGADVRGVQRGTARGVSSVCLSMV